MRWSRLVHLVLPNAHLRTPLCNTNPQAKSMPLSRSTATLPPGVGRRASTTLCLGRLATAPHTRLDPSVGCQKTCSWMHGRRLSTVPQTVDVPNIMASPIKSSFCFFQFCSFVFLIRFILGSNDGGAGPSAALGTQWVGDKL